ncbi:MAG: hypothetical protein AAF479_04840 [Pseudomonadota bacterium]
MSRKPGTQARPYRFGPFELDLPDGWTGAFEDGVHTIASDAHDTALQFSGFERATKIEMSDLYAMVPPGMQDLSRFTLPSGLDGFAWVDPNDQTRRMVIRHETVVLAITEVAGDEPDDSDGEMIEEIIGTLAATKGAS